MAIATTLNELRHIRRKTGLSQENIAYEIKTTRQYVQLVETGKRKITDDYVSKIARGIDDPEFYLTVARKLTGGVMVSPWLNGVDEHRLVGVMKFLEEVREAITAVEKIIPIVLRAQNEKMLQQGEREQIEAALLEVIEAITAAENALARLAKTYNISLAALYDKHQQELIEKGYLKKEKGPKA